MNLAPEKSDIIWLDCVETLTYQHSLLLVGGAPGVGKTTLLQRLSPEALVVSSDEVYQWFEDQSSDGVSQKAVHQRIEELVSARLAQGPVIIDAPGLFPNLRYRYSELAREKGLLFHGLMLDGDPALFLQGQINRGGLLKPEAHELYCQYWRELRLSLKMGERQGFDSVVVADRQAANHLQEIRFS